MWQNNLEENLSFLSSEITQQLSLKLKINHSSFCSIFCFRIKSYFFLFLIIHFIEIEAASPLIPEKLSNRSNFGFEFGRH